jgi:hypothetical protein
MNSHCFQRTFPAPITNLRTVHCFEICNVMQFYLGFLSADFIDVHVQFFSKK